MYKCTGNGVLKEMPYCSYKCTGISVLKEMPYCSYKCTGISVLKEMPYCSYKCTGISVSKEMPYCSFFSFFFLHVSILCMLHVLSVPSEWTNSLEIKIDGVDDESKMYVHTISVLYQKIHLYIVDKAT